MEQIKGNTRLAQSETLMPQMFSSDYWLEKRTA